ncbi:MAG: DUF3883 domain-containing protein [Flavobacteriales bacterium]|jgi:hypothetical protein|nr:DUF3883 domain-containing protein [Flavobacteriales bacterium]
MPSWTTDEVEKAVAAYFDMLRREVAQEKVNKVKVYRNLEEEGIRTTKSYEFKMQNISAVLALNDLPFLKGLVPAKNFQRMLEPLVMAYVDAHADIREALLRYGAGRTAQLRLHELLETPNLVEESAPPHAAKETTRRFEGKFIDFAAREHACRRLGASGEELIMTYEQHRLTQAGREDLAQEVEWVARTQGDGLGYDIRSFTTDDQERYIEVKTTNFDKATPFLLTGNELDFSKANAPRYKLYRLFDFGRKPGLFTLSGSMEQACVLEATMWRAWGR